MTRRIIVKQPRPPEPEIATEILASSIVAISDGIKQLRGGRLNDKALLLLIQASVKKPKVSGKQIKAVLDALENLQATYLRKADNK